MSQTTKTILMLTAGLTAMTMVMPAAAQDRDRRERVGGGRQAAAEQVMQNPRREAVREGRREERRARIERAQVPAPVAAQSPAAQQRNAEAVARRMERVNGSRDRVENRRNRDWAERRAAGPARVDDRRERREDWRERGEDRRERIEDRRERNEDWRERREDRRERVEDRVERRDDWRNRNDNWRDRRDDRRDDWRDRRNVRNDRWRDARRHSERERWRNHYRWPRVVVYPSNRYSYRPHWWGQQYYYFDSRYNNYGYDYGSNYRPGYGYYGSQGGSGWSVVYPWLRQDSAARHWVMWSFDANRNGRLGNDEARRANREFERLADRNRDGYLSDSEISFGVEELRDEYRYSYQYG